MSTEAQPGGAGTVALPSDDPRIRARRERMAGTQRRNRGGPLLGIVLFIAFLALAALVLFPDAARDLLGFGTSESEEMQRTSRVDDSGISTIITPPPAPEITIETAPPEVTVVTPPARTERTEPAELSEEARARIAALEDALKRLADRPVSEPGPTAAEIKALLDGQAAVLREEAETRERLLQAELDALRAAAAARPAAPPRDDAAELERLRLEAEEHRRLREALERRQAERRAELERRRAEREAELAKRRTSDLNVFDDGEEGMTDAGVADEKEGVRELSDNELFLRDQGRTSYETVRAKRLGDTSRLIVQGTVIAAVLETAIDTELPGTIRAQVSRPVFSYDGSEVLMPAGTRLIGSYNPKVSIAQKRVLIAWNRAITPEGRSVTLAATGTDRLGRAGQRGNVDTRFLQRFGSAALISTIKAIPGALSGNREGDEDESTGVTVARGVGEDVSDDLGDASEDALEEYLKLPPVIRVPQGTRMRVLVNQDLDFS